MTKNEFKFQYKKRKCYNKVEPLREAVFALD